MKQRKIYAGYWEFNREEKELSEILSGTIYSERRFFKGTVEFDQGEILRVSEGEDSDPKTSNRLIMPPFSDFHTHIGDVCLRGKIDFNLSLEEIVKPPHGLKHELLSRTSDEEIRSGIACAMMEMRENGIGCFIDFREGGERGIALLKESLDAERRLTSKILGRPENLEYHEKEIDAILDKSDGIGLSAVSDWDYDKAMQIAIHAKSRSKMFALHASEANRERIDRILDLDPDFLVHMTSADREDLIQCKDNGIPIIVCPRSNLRFGLQLDISTMLDLGLVVRLGTDNSMFNSLSMIDEMRAAYSLPSNSRQLTVEEIFELAYDDSRKVINDENLISIKPGRPQRVIVIESAEGLTPERLISSDVKYNVRVIDDN